jgi:Ca2+-binding EF-hand superfamily protein
MLFFTSSATVREVSSAVALELSQQIQQLRSDILNSNAQCSGASHGHQSHGDHHENGHDHGHLLFSVHMIKLISESLTAIGVAIILLSAIGIIPLIITDIIPVFFRPKAVRGDVPSSLLFCRMQLARGIMLGMDFMVAADVVETLLHQIDMVKLLCIIAIRSWLGFERSKEAQHISHEIDHWKKAHPLLAKEFGDVLGHEQGLTQRIRETFKQYDRNQDGTVSKKELSLAFDRVGLEVNEQEMSLILGDKDAVSLEQFENSVRQLIKDATKH